MFSPVVLSPPTWSNSAELGADDILKSSKHVLNRRKVSWIVGVPTSYQGTSNILKGEFQNKRDEDGNAYSDKDQAVYYT